MNLDRLEREITKKIYRESYYEFFKDAFAQLHKGSPYDDNWHLEYICGVLEKEFWRIHNREQRTKDIIVNVPFRSAKSMVCTIIFPIWAWSIDPTFKFICVSYSGKLALEHAQLSKDLINSNWFQYYYGDRVVIRHDTKAKEFYKTTEDGFRKSVGTGGQITGSGADMLIIDDPQNPQMASSETERQNTIDFYDHTLFSRLNQPDVGARLIVMQRLHEGDLTGHLMDKDTGRPEEHHHICIPGELDEEIISPPELAEYYINGLFWNTRFNAKMLSVYKKALGSLQYAGQIGQRPAPPEGKIIKRKWFEIVLPDEITRNAFVEPIHFIFDTAYTEKQQNDPSGTIAYFTRNGIMYIVNAAEVRKEFPELVKWIDEYVRINDYTYSSGIYIEPKASGKSIVQQLRNISPTTGGRLNVIEIEGDFLRDDKITRANSISPILEAGRVKLVRGDWNAKFLDQLAMFPAAKHDEFVDCLCYGVFYALGGADKILGSSMGVSDRFGSAQRLGLYS